jgi:uncharacterized protein
MSRGLVPGLTSAEVLTLDEPLSLWGGVDTETGRIVERGHPQYGASIAGRVLSMPHGRGSSSSSSVLAEMLRLGVGPAGIVLQENDSILVVGALVAQALYGTICPVVVTADKVGPGVWEVDGNSGTLKGALENLAANADNNGI